MSLRPSVKILHLENGKHLYGGARQVLYLLERLRGLGCDNLLVCPRGSAIEQAARPFAQVIPVAVAGDLDPSFGLRLHRLCRHARPDLLHVHSRRGADWWGALAARINRIPAVISRRVDNPEPRLVVRVKYRFFNKVITISKQIERILVAEGLAPERVTCVPSGIPFPRPASPEEGRRRLASRGIDPRARLVAVVAQLIGRKGHRYLLETVPRILRRYPATHFLLFGRGPLLGDLQRRCRTLGIGDHVHFMGFRRDLQCWLPAVDVVAHPALMEGLGIALLEAAAAARPIVAFAAGGVPEIVTHQVNGLLVPPGDGIRLGDAIMALLGSPSKAARMGAAGRRKVLDQFSADAMAEGNYRVYREVLERANLR